MAESTISLSDLLDFFLLLQGIRRLQVALLNVDKLIGKDLSNGLLGPEGMLTNSLGDQVDGLVDSSEGRHIYCLLSNHTTSTDSGGVLSRAGLHNSVDEDLKRVSSGKEMDDLEGVPDNTNGLDLLTSVPAVELEGSNESLDDGAEGFSELLALVSASSVGDEDLSLSGGSGDVVDEAGVSNLS